VLLATLIPKTLKPGSRDRGIVVQTQALKFEAVRDVLDVARHRKDVYSLRSLAAFCKNLAGIGWRSFQIIFIGRLFWWLT
jgi:type III secretory pathway component EscU